MTFHSILFETNQDQTTTETPQAPPFLIDLNLDQIIDAITAGKEEYNLKPLFYTLLNTVDAIDYRHGVMRDLENKILFEQITSFAQQMRLMRDQLAQAAKLHYKYQKESWFVDAVQIYCNTVNRLVYDLSLVELKSRGLLAFRQYLTSYAESSRYTTLLAETEKLKANLADVKYCLLIKGNGFKVRKFASEADYSASVEKTFAKFKLGAVKSYAVKFHVSPDMNHIEAKVLDFVARLYPDTFSLLDDYCLKHRDYQDERIGQFDREIQFYLSYLGYIARFTRAELRFCYPKISTSDKAVYDYDGFDLALAYKLIAEESSVVCNEFYLKGEERIFVVSGPNQGGKTTFARAFGQLHYLAGIGCPVPGTKAQLFLFDRMFTHFEKQESIKDLHGKLQDDLVRIHDILSRVTTDSIIIMNESFTSTTLQDAIFLSKKVMERIMQLDAFCVCVTFIDELASLSEKTVSMVSTVVPENPATRTYKIVRRSADGLAYAISIAEKHRLTYDRLKERMKA